MEPKNKTVTIQALENWDYRGKTGTEILPKGGICKAIYRDEYDEWNLDLSSQCCNDISRHIRPTHGPGLRKVSRSFMRTSWSRDLITVINIYN